MAARPGARAPARARRRTARAWRARRAARWAWSARARTARSCCGRRPSCAACPRRPASCCPAAAAARQAWPTRGRSPSLTCGPAAGRLLKRFHCRKNYIESRLAVHLSPSNGTGGALKRAAGSTAAGAALLRARAPAPAPTSRAPARRRGRRPGGALLPIAPQHKPFRGAPHAGAEALLHARVGGGRGGGARARGHRPQRGARRPVAGRLRGPRLAWCARARLSRMHGACGRRTTAC